MEHWLSMVDCVRNSMDKGSSMRHRSMDYRSSMVRDNLYTTIRELHTVLSFHNSIFILTLCLGKVSTISISTTILISKWLRGELFLMVWSWVWSWVIRSRSRGIRSRDCRCTQGRAKEEGNNKALHAAMSK